jgi:hypothetical protein
MTDTTLHDSAAPRRGAQKSHPLCCSSGTAARPRAPHRRWSFVACPAAISPIRFRSPPFKRENEQLNKHLAINQLLLFTARRHSSQRVYLNVHEVWLFKELCKIDSSKNGKTEEPLRAGNRRRKTLSIFFLRTLLLRASNGNYSDRQDTFR